MNEPRQNSFSANTSAWRFVVGWNLKYPDVCGTAIVSPVELRTCVADARYKRDDWPIVPWPMAPAKVLTMDEARREGTGWDCCKLRLAY
jgi:hypothetical protein